MNTTPRAIEAAARTTAQRERPISSPLTISLISFALIFGGAFAGARLRNALPQHHLSEGSKDVIRLGSGLVATIAALVLSLLISSAKTSYDTQNAQIGQLTSDVVMVDHLLDGYGPQTREARVLLRRTVDALADRIWPQLASPSASAAPFETAVATAQTYAEILKLAPQTDAQRALRDRAVQIIIDASQVRLMMSARGGPSIPTPFLAILVFWLAIIFASFSLFSPLNATTVVALGIFALSAAGAIFLILEMDQPFSGLMQIPSGLLRHALPPLGH